MKTNWLIYEYRNLSIYYTHYVYIPQIPVHPFLLTAHLILPFPRQHSSGLLYAHLVINQ